MSHTHACPVCGGTYECSFALEPEEDGPGYCLAELEATEQEMCCQACVEVPL